MLYTVSFTPMSRFHNTAVRSRQRRGITAPNLLVRGYELKKLVLPDWSYRMLWYRMDAQVAEYTVK